MMHRTRPRRHGTAYLLILGVAMLLTIIGVSSIIAVRAQRQAAEMTGDAAEARLYAQSGIELALLWINEAADWRTVRGEGEWVTKQPLGNGTFTVQATDLGPKADLSTSSDGDPVLLTATGYKGDARHKLQVRLAAPPSGDPLTCLESALHAGSDIEFTTSTVDSDGIVSGNASAKADGASVNATVEVVTIASGASYTPAPTEGVSPRTMPGTGVFDPYIASGTSIAYADLTSGRIEETLLSPGVNPYGAGQTNAEGIYVIDCQGSDITIQSCRIVGTLVLLNAGAGSEVTGQLNWEPAVANYPSLLVQGSLTASFSAWEVLNEGQWSVNFNPLHTPYEGQGDSDKDDIFPTILKGLVYVSGDLSVDVNPVFSGSVVAGGVLSASGQMTFNYQLTFSANPPPGFTTPSGDMEILAGSWAQVVD